MQPRVVNLQKKASLITERHKYKLIAEVNNYQFKLVKAKREFVLHKHSETDELFFVVEGEMKLQIEEEIFELHPGELCVVPKGKMHKPICDSECTVMLVEPNTTINTGDGASNTLTDLELEWI